MVNTIGALSDFRQTQKQTEQTASTNAALQTHERNMASGRRVHTLADAGPDGSRLLSFQETLREIETDQSNITQTTTRVQGMNVILKQIQNRFADFKNRLVGVLSEDGNRDPTFCRDAQSLMEDIGSMLNRSDADGRFYFGGAKVQPQQTDILDPNSLGVVDVSRIPQPHLGDGGPSTAYYLGDDTIQTLTLEDGKTIPYGVTAGNDSFAQLFYALKIAATTPPDSTIGSNSRAMLERALSSANEAQEALVPLVAVSEATEGILNDTGQTLDDARSVAEGKMAQITDADITAEFVALKTLEEMQKVQQTLLLMDLKTIASTLDNFRQAAMR